MQRSHLAERKQESANRGLNTYCTAGSQCKTQSSSWKTTKCSCRPNVDLNFFSLLSIYVFNHLFIHLFISFADAPSAGAACEKVTLAAVPPEHSSTGSAMRNKQQRRGGERAIPTGRGRAAPVPPQPRGRNHKREWTYKKNGGAVVKIHSAGVCLAAGRAKTQQSTSVTSSRTFFFVFFKLQENAF